jgi:hypothetical protein
VPAGPHAEREQATAAYRLHRAAAGRSGQRGPDGRGGLAQVVRLHPHAVDERMAHPRSAPVVRPLTR